MTGVPRQGPFVIWRTSLLYTMLKMLKWNAAVALLVGWFFHVPPWPRGSP